MTIDSGVIALVGLFGTIIGLIVGGMKVAGTFRSQGERMGRQEFMVTTLWDVFMKGARVDAIRAGIFQQNSPVILNPAVAQQFGVLAGRIKRFYEGNALANESDSTAILQLANEFGDDIAEKVADGLIAPNLGAALWAALQLCRDSP